MAATWLHVEPKPAIQLQLPVSIRAFSLLTLTQTSESLVFIAWQ